ncbi:MFS transporter [Mesoterricola sediminis]|uniref:MFS transporter n=1 Tax=Mesoterricola sediminis TaxID=2927980 RepID=A0AA48GPI0_9BACT|nr:MFS transporter [Mesoterricola sediminis]BDU76871.1 MFS transporter [Mesoterricola sediminis]
MAVEAGDPRRWALLALTSVGAFMAPLDGSIVAVALPRMGPALHLSYGASLWVQAAYLLAMAVTLIPLGRLADRAGKVRFYLAGVVVFTVGSLAAALATSGATLVAARVVQGVGGSLLSATSAAIVTGAFPPHERGRALGINVMAVYAGLSVGPPLGGFLVDHLGWPWIFLVNLPVGLVTLLWGWALLPRREASGARPGQADLGGALLMALLLSALIVPLTFSSEWGFHAPRTWGLLATVPLLLAAFLAREARVPEPILDLGLLRRNRLFASANLAALLNYCALYAVSVLTAVQLQLVMGHPARTAGWVMMGQPVMQACLSPVAGRLSDRVGSRSLATAGMLLVALGMAGLALLGRGAGLGAVVAALAVVGLGMAAFSAPNTSAIMGSVDRRQLGLAGAFLPTMRVTGQALSVALLGGIAASRLGPGGWKALLRHASTGAADAFAWGYRAAMLTGALLAVLGAVASLQRQERMDTCSNG